MRNKNTLILIVVLVFIAAGLMTLSFLNLTKKEGGTPSVTPNPLPTNVETRITPPPDFNSEAISTATYSTEAAKLNQKEFLIGDLIKNPPRSGTLFSLTYVFANDSFTLILNGQRIIEARKEFEDYLKQNGLNAADLTNIVTRFN